MFDLLSSNFLFCKAAINHLYEGFFFFLYVGDIFLILSERRFVITWIICNR